MDMTAALKKDMKILIEKQIQDDHICDEDLSPLKYFMTTYLMMPQWASLCDDISTQSLEHLIRVVTLAEKQQHLRGGSVATGIWLFRILQGRLSDPCNELADWILHRTDNPYMPYGRSNGGAKSVNEYNDFMQRCYVEHAITHLRIENEQEKKQERLEQKKRKYENRKSEQSKNTTERRFDT